jgi:uncharacterized small protein (DUF1192 family)
MKIEKVARDKIIDEIFKESDATIADLKAKIDKAAKDMEVAVEEAKKTRQSEIDKLNAEIAKLNADLAAKSASPTSTPGDDMTKQIADLKAELDKAKAASASASASPNKAKIEAILLKFKAKEPYDDGKYIISELSEGFHIKLKAKP